MPTPSPISAQAQRLITFYNEAEREILQECNRLLLASINGNILGPGDYSSARMQQIRKDLLEGSRTWVQEAIPYSYMKGVDIADTSLPPENESIADFGEIHQKTAEALGKSTYSRLMDVISVVDRRVDDIFRKLELENTKSAVLGDQKEAQVAAKIKDDLAENGITGFVDKAGKSWNMSSYIEVLAQESTMQSFREGITNRLQEKAQDLVFIPAHSGSCKKCAEFEGKMYSLSGNDEKYPPLSEAIDGGMFHINCTHYVEAYRKTAE
jgi:hypothetical protein